MGVLNRDTEITWLGHATFRIRTPGGKTVLVDPWILGNPATPEPLKRIEKVDLQLITHGHGDHVGDAIQIGKETGARTVGIFEMYLWLTKKGVPNAVGMNKGGTLDVDGIKVTMVHAVHSCGVLDGDQVIYAGEACGYVITLENGFRIYHAGDTMIFGDMRLIGEIWQPDIAMLPIGDLYTMDPRQAALAARMLGVKAVIPMHFGTFPALTGTPEQLAEHLKGSGIEVLALKPGESLT